MDGLIGLAVHEAVRFGWLLPLFWAAKVALTWVLWRRVRAWRARRALVTAAARDI